MGETVYFCTMSPPQRFCSIFFAEYRLCDLFLVQITRFDHVPLINTKKGRNSQRGGFYEV